MSLATLLNVWGPSGFGTYRGASILAHKLGGRVRISNLPLEGLPAHRPVLGHKHGKVPNRDELAQGRQSLEGGKTLLSFSLTQEVESSSVERWDSRLKGHSSFFERPCGGDISLFYVLQIRVPDGAVIMRFVSGDKCRHGEHNRREEG